MSDKLMSRRKFLTGAGAVVGAATVSGLVLAKDPSTAEAAATVNVPWPYPADPGLQPDPETLARRGFETFNASGCCEGTWWPLVEYLAALYPDTWGTVPKNMFRFGGGGIAGWGTICGTLNGSAALIGMTVANGTHRTNLTNAIFQYYATTPLPTNDAYKSHLGQLGLPSTWDPAVRIPIDNAPTSTADSPLCHASLVQWTMTTGASDGGPLQKDRCGKAVFDVMFKNVQLLNAYFTAASAPSVPLDPSVAACGACHVTYTGAKMACSSCHENTLDHWNED
jgi:hypothetical protein